jgi:hypothetical protein
MEKLSLPEFNDIRRPTKGKVLVFESVSKGFQSKTNIRMASCTKATLLIGWLRWTMAALIWCLPTRLTTKANWDSFESQEHTIAWSVQWISQVSRVLKHTGFLYVCYY